MFFNVFKIRGAELDWSMDREGEQDGGKQRWPWVFFALGSLEEAVSFCESSRLRPELKNRRSC